MTAKYEIINDIVHYYDEDDRKFTRPPPVDTLADKEKVKFVSIYDILKSIHSKDEVKKPVYMPYVEEENDIEQSVYTYDSTPINTPSMSEDEYEAETDEELNTYIMDNQIYKKFNYTS